MPIDTNAMTDFVAKTRNQAGVDRIELRRLQLEAVDAAALQLKDHMLAGLGRHQQAVIANRAPYTVDTVCDRYRDPEFHPDNGWTPRVAHLNASISCISSEISRCDHLLSIDLGEQNEVVQRLLKPTVDAAKALGFRARFQISAGGYSGQNALTVDVSLRNPEVIKATKGEAALNDNDKKFLEG